MGEDDDAAKPKKKSKALRRFIRGVNKVRRAQKRNKKVQHVQIDTVSNTIKKSSWMANLLLNWHGDIKRSLQRKDLATLAKRAQAVARKDPKIRTDHDLETLTDWLKSMELPVLADLSEDALYQFSKYFRLREFGAREIVIRQGDFGSEFFILFSGEASVHVAKPGEQGYGHGVAIIKATKSVWVTGDAFVRGCRGVRGILSFTFRYFLFVATNQALENMGQKAHEIVNRRNQKMKFLEGHYLFKDWGLGRLSSFAYCMQAHKQEGGAWLYEKDSSATMVYFLLEGRCILMAPEKDPLALKKAKKHLAGQRMRLAGHKVHNIGFVRIMALGEGSLIGEEEVVHARATRRLAVTRYHFKRYFQGKCNTKVQKFLEAKLQVQENILKGRQFFHHATKTKHHHEDVQTPRGSGVDRLVQIDDSGDGLSMIQNRERKEHISHEHKHYEEAADLERYNFTSLSCPHASMRAQKSARPAYRHTYINMIYIMRSDFSSILESKGQGEILRIMDGKTDMVASLMARRQQEQRPQSAWASASPSEEEAKSRLRMGISTRGFADTRHTTKKLQPESARGEYIARGSRSTLQNLHRCGRRASHGGALCIQWNIVKAGSDLSATRLLQHCTTEGLCPSTCSRGLKLTPPDTVIYQPQTAPTRQAFPRRKLPLGPKTARASTSVYRFKTQQLHIHTPSSALRITPRENPAHGLALTAIKANPHHRRRRGNHHHHKRRNEAAGSLTGSFKLATTALK
eukprot:jgi/Bigna1/79200/fgenesh1_pg.60_\